jgi:dienelactone hydrolase
MWRAAAALALALSFPALAQQPLTGRLAESYRGYEAYAPHRAFAVGGGSAFRWVGGSGSLEKVIDDALAGCARNNGEKPCTLYSVNNVVLGGRDWRAAVPARDPAAADIGRLRPHPYVAMRGPQAATGLVVWSHGYRQGSDATQSPAQPYVGRFVAAGYDLYRFDRQYITDWPGDATALVAAVAQAWQMGYRRIVLAGQSAGGWVSIAALARGASVDGVIAVAPAHHGETHKMGDVSVARSAWQQIIGAVKPGPRVAVVLFAGDTYDVGGRGADAKAALARNGVSHLVVDQPQNFTGHGAGASSTFDRVYGACLVSFVETGAAPCQ